MTAAQVVDRPLAAGGKVRKYGLGPVHTVSLAEARDKAAEVRRLILDGIDPREARRAEQDEAAVAQPSRSASTKRAPTSRAIRPDGSPTSTPANGQATLQTYASPVFGKLPVSAIDTGMVMRVLEPIWSSKNETANRVRGRIEAILSWAKVHGYRSGENPAQWRGHLDHLLPARSKVHKVEHHAALPYDELPAFMRDLRERYGVAALALEFAILTATRTSETLNAAWSEFDLDKRLWIIPGRAHEGRARASRAAVRSRRRHRRGNARRSSAATSCSPVRSAASRCQQHGDVDRRCAGWSATTSPSHGFRATFRTWAAETNQLPARSDRGRAGARHR